MEDNDFELRDKMLDYIHADLENCTHSELCIINKFIRTNIIAQLPNSEKEEPKTNTQQLKAEICHCSQGNTWRETFAVSLDSRTTVFCPTCGGKLSAIC